jgi:glycosyltransferase involved in cell wall biosynthesis
MAATHGCGGSRVKGALLAAESFWQSQVLATYDDISIFVAPSEFMRGRLAEMGFRHPVVLLRNGVELDAGPIVSTAERFHVGFAGRLSSEKGVGLLLDAARRLPGLRFRVAGSGPEAVALRRRIEQENLTQVELLGHLDQRALRAEMRTWRLAVVPSIMYENCPYAVLDAMACHVPVLGADAGGMSELAANGRGLTFRRGDAGALAQKIDAAFTDLGQLQRLAREGVRFVQDECSPERHVRGQAFVYKQRAFAAPDGAFEMLFPYSTDGSSSAVVATGPIQLLTAAPDGQQRVVTFTVSEQAVHGHERVVLGDLRASD